MTIETHPLSPFLPLRAKTLFLGSFPPPRFRWSIEFFYPNWINDFWRIMGIVFFDDKSYFEIPEKKMFDKEKIVAFAESQRLAFFDTATKVRRLNDDASDKFLEIIQPTDVLGMIGRMPECTDVVTTGGKASDELFSQLSPFFADGKPQQPKVGEYAAVSIDGRLIRWWRMPSSSRAYPLPIGKKSDFYRRIFQLVTE